MADAIIQMYGGPSSDTDDVSSIDMPEDGLLMGVFISMQSPSMVQGKEMQVEISFLSSSQFTTNDARGIIAHTCLATATPTTEGGAGAMANTNIIFHSGITIAAGERIHMHFETSDSVLCRIHALLIFKFKGGIRSVRRR